MYTKSLEKGKRIWPSRRHGQLMYLNRYWVPLPEARDLGEAGVFLKKRWIHAWINRLSATWWELEEFHMKMTSFLNKTGCEVMVLGNLLYYSEILCYQSVPGFGSLFLNGMESTMDNKRGGCSGKKFARQWAAFACRVRFVDSRSTQKGINTTT